MATLRTRLAAMVSSEEPDLLRAAAQVPAVPKLVVAVPPAAERLRGVRFKPAARLVLEAQLHLSAEGHPVLVEHCPQAALVW